MVVDHGVAVAIDVLNTGSAKATDVFVRIEFPPEVMVMTVRDAKKLPVPKAPEKPEDLETIAYERAHKLEAQFMDNTRMFEQLHLPNPLAWPDISADIEPVNIYENLEVSDNKVEIECRQGIVHTRSVAFDGVYIVPLKTGEYSVKITYMCTEYDEPDVKELKIYCE